MRKHQIALLLVIVVLIPHITSCATPMEGAASGGLLGAGAGAVIGSIIGAAAGSPETGAWVGAAIGGTVGAMAGAAQGAENQRRMQELHRAKLGDKLDAGWKGPNGEITGTLQVENNRLYYCLGEDYLVWDTAGGCWYAEN